MIRARLLFIQQAIDVEAPASQVCHLVASIGGVNGWYYANWLWKLRGWIDKCIGGVGLRGRRDVAGLVSGEALDFWRVEEFLPGRLKLRAEMITWGHASLQFDIEPLGLMRSHLTVTGRYVPEGLAGWTYWIALYPIHLLVFSGMARSISRVAATDAFRFNAAIVSSCDNASRADTLTPRI